MGGGVEGEYDQNTFYKILELRSEKKSSKVLTHQKKNVYKEIYT